MHEMLCFAGQNVPRKMDGEACLWRAGAEHVRLGSDHARIGCAVELPVQAKEVSRASFVFPSSTFTFWAMSRTKASFQIFHRGANSLCDNVQQF